MLNHKLKLTNILIFLDYICTRHAAKMMVPRRSGLIVEIGSLGGVFYVYNTAYGINKVAVC
jgi:dehydrogenase/reductase SDR family protein 1